MCASSRSRSPTATSTSAPSSTSLRLGSRGTRAVGPRRGRAGPGDGAPRPGPRRPGRVVRGPQDGRGRDAGSRRPVRGLDGGRAPRSSRLGGRRSAPTRSASGGDARCSLADGRCVPRQPSSVSHARRTRLALLLATCDSEPPLATDAWTLQPDPVWTGDIIASNPSVVRGSDGSSPLPLGEGHARGSARSEGASSLRSKYACRRAQPQMPRAKTEPQGSCSTIARSFAKDVPSPAGSGRRSRPSADRHQRTSRTPRRHLRAQAARETRSP